MTRQRLLAAISAEKALATRDKSRLRRRGRLAGHNRAPPGAPSIFGLGVEPGLNPIFPQSPVWYVSRGAGGGSRTLTPLRTRDFESRASAIPPLRQRETSTAAQRLECSKRSARQSPRGGSLAAGAGGLARCRGLESRVCHSATPARCCDERPAKCSKGRAPKTEEAWPVASDRWPAETEMRSLEGHR